jgi:hypothetical protein
MPKFDLHPSHKSVLRNKGGVESVKYFRPKYAGRADALYRSRVDCIDCNTLPNPEFVIPRACKALDSSFTCLNDRQHTKLPELRISHQYT